MKNKTLFRDTFSVLHASDRTVKEVLKMTQKKMQVLTKILDLQWEGGLKK